MSSTALNEVLGILPPTFKDVQRFRALVGRYVRIFKNSAGTPGKMPGMGDFEILQTIGYGSLANEHPKPSIYASNIPDAAFGHWHPSKQLEPRDAVTMRTTSPRSLPKECAGCPAQL